MIHQQGGTCARDYGAGNENVLQQNICDNNYDENAFMDELIKLASEEDYEQTNEVEMNQDKDPLLLIPAGHEAIDETMTAPSVSSSRDHGSYVSPSDNNHVITPDVISAAALSPIIAPSSEKQILPPVVPCAPTLPIEKTCGGLVTIAGNPTLSAHSGAFFSPSLQPSSKLPLFYYSNMNHLKWEVPNPLRKASTQSSTCSNNLISCDGAIQKLSCPITTSSDQMTPTSIKSELQSLFKTNKRGGTKVRFDEEEIKRRRERNRKHARKSREKKRNAVCMLESKLNAMENENKILRQLLVVEVGPEKANKMLHEIHKKKYPISLL